MIQEMAEWLEDELIVLVSGALLEAGVNLFAGHIPEKRLDGTQLPSEVIILLENAGGATVPDVKDRKDWNLQVLSRDTNYIDARNNAYLIYDRLHQNTAQRLPTVDALSGTSFVAMTIEAINVPLSIGQDEKGLWQISTNFIVRIRDFEV